MRPVGAGAYSPSRGFGLTASSETGERNAYSPSRGFGLTASSEAGEEGCPIPGLTHWYRPLLHRTSSQMGSRARLDYVSCEEE